MSNSRIEEGTIYIGTEELSILIGHMIRGYKFLNQNNEPKKVVIPHITEVKGVKINYALPEEAAGKPTASQKVRRTGKSTDG